MSPDVSGARGAGRSDCASRRRGCRGRHSRLQWLQCRFPLGRRGIALGTGARLREDECPRYAGCFRRLSERGRLPSRLHEHALGCRRRRRSRRCRRDDWLCTAVPQPLCADQGTGGAGATVAQRDGGRPRLRAPPSPDLRTWRSAHDATPSRRGPCRKAVADR